MAGNWAAEWVNAAAKPNPSLSTWRTPRKSFPDPRVPRVPARSSADPYGVRPVRPPISNLRPQDNQINQYPEGVSRGKPAAPTPAAAPRRPMPSQNSTPIPNSAPMPGFGTPRVQVPAGRGRATALNTAAQQAGAGVRYTPLANDAGIAVAERARMIQEARAAGNPTPANLTPASENYYQQADIAAWGAKNPELLKALRSRNGLPETPASDAFAPAPVAFSPRFDERMSRAGAYGMQSNLAPGAAQAVPGQDLSLGRQAVTDRTGMAFEPGFDLRQQETPGAYPMANVPVQTAFDPNLDLMGRGKAAGYSAANVPVQTAFNPDLDLMGGSSPAAAPQYAQAFRQQPTEAEEFNQRYLRQIKGMRSSGMGSIGNVAFNPGAFNSGAGYL